MQYDSQNFEKATCQPSSVTAAPQLISEPNLTNRDAALLGSLTNSGSLVVSDNRTADYSMSRAIYAGENPATHKIQNSVHIHIGVTNAALPTPAEWVHETTEHLPAHLSQYRDSNLAGVKRCAYFPTG